MKTMRVVYVMLCLGLLASPITAQESAQDATNESLRSELLAMEKTDQDARKGMLKRFADAGISVGGGQPITNPEHLTIFKEEFEKVSKIDSDHRARLKEIIEAHGWPGKSLVGQDGAKAAWLIVQHADNDRAFQKSCLSLMEQAAAGEVEGKSLAYLTDRVLVGENKPQRYGTQLDGNFKPNPIEDEENVDKRRAAVGLPPLAEYIEYARAEYEKAAKGEDGGSQGEGSKDKEKDPDQDSR